MDQNEFKFPDEKIKAESQENIEIEVEGENIEIEVEEKPKYSKLRQEPQAPDDEELKEYSDRVRNRIDHLYKGYKTEKERAEEAEKALRYLSDENQKLKNTLSEGQMALLEQAKKTVANELEDAKRKYKEAYESGDSDRVVTAQEELTAAKIKLERVNNFKPTRQEPQKEVQTNNSVYDASKSDHKAEAWKRRNEWFGPDVEMTGFALAYHQKLIQQGVDPTSDSYYEKLDSRMRQVFPENFDAEESPRRSVRSNVVAPATRSSAPKKVKLTQKQVEYAKRYNIPLQRYALEVAKINSRS
jgi:hypothetical protein